VTNLPELVTDKDTFLGLRSECETIIDTQKRLPDFAFRRSYAKYFVIEHGEIQRKKFWSFLSEIANSCKDEFVNYMTLDPDPESYYFHHHHFYGLASFRPSSLMERYLPVMSRDGHADSFFARGGDVGAFWGSSLKWGIICDRISWELAVIGISADIQIPAEHPRFMDSAFLLGYMKSLYSTDPSKASEFTKSLVTNYRI
jgi:hypothetical protein